MNKRNEGFTLLEILIVLTIVAVIIASILSTRSLIRGAQIQAVMSEYQMYAGAIKNFKSKYYALPGDFAGATALWGEVSASCKVGAATGTQTCNGNGNGLIEFDTSNYEHIAAWRHLGLSGFINQNFTGNTFGSTVCNIDIKGGETSPISRLKGATWNIGADTTGTIYTTGGAGTQFIPINACNNLTGINVLWLGGSLQNDDAQSASCAHSQIPVFTGQEAYQLDTKFDDKRAYSGKIRSQYNNTTAYETCEDSSSSNGQYRTSATGVNCSLVFFFER